MSRLQISVDSDKDLAVMNLRGRISIETSPDLRIRLLAILRTLNFSFAPGGTFTQVKPYDGRPDIDYVLTGQLEKLEEIDYEGGVKVEVAISAQMMELSNGATVWANSVSEVSQVNQRDVPSVVSEMSRTMERAIDKLLTPGPAVLSKQPMTARRNAK